MNHDGEPTTAADRAAAEPRTLRGVLVAVLSLLIPGTGQLAVGAWRRGLIMLGFTALLLIVWHGISPTQMAIEALSRSGGLAELLVGNLLLAVLRVYATLDAFRLGSGGLTRSSDEQALTGASLGAVATLAVVAIAPHAVAAHYTFVADDLLGSIFAEPDAQEDRSQGATRVATGDRASRYEAGTQEPEPDDPNDVRPSWLHDDDHLTVAVLGSDAAPSRPGDRLDAMMVVSVQPATGRVAIFSVERHLRGFPLPDGLHAPWVERCRDAAPGWDLLNSVYRCADEVLVDEVATLYPDARDPAAAAVADTLGIMLGLSVDHYVMVDLRGFIELVDAIGGVELDLSSPRGVDRDAAATTEGCDWRAFDVQPESHRLDGRAALELVRNRDDTFEADRMARQRCMLITLTQQVDTSTMLRRFEQLAGVLRQNLATSIPLNELPALIELLDRIDRDTIVTKGFGQPDHILADGSPYLDLIRDDVESILEGSPMQMATPRAPR